MFALGVASQTLMYPNSDPTWTLLYNVVYYPYYAVYQQYPTDQLSGKYIELHVRSHDCVAHYLAMASCFNGP